MARGTTRPRLGDTARAAFVAAVCFAIYAAFIPNMVRALDPLTGDEPFYVMTALSITRDGDIDERNNYDERDYDSFYPPQPLPEDWQGWALFPPDLMAHPADSVRPGLYSKHGLGVAALILIPYAIGGRIGTVLFLNLVGALVATNMVLLARRYGHGWLVAAALSALLAFSNPLMSYSYLIFPEILAALALIYAFRRSRETESNAWQWFAAGLAIATLPWLHARFIPPVIGLVALLAGPWIREPSPRRRLAGILPPALSAIALLAFYLYVYGHPFPSMADHAGFNPPLDFVNAAFGLFLDEQWGLLIHAPVYLLVAAGLGTLWRHSRNEVLALLAVALPYLALLALYKVWWGDWGPAARYLAPIAPLAIAPIACWVAHVRRAGAFANIALLAIPGFVIMGGFLAAPQLMYNHPLGHNALFTAWADGINKVWPKVIPSFQSNTPSPTEVRVGWSLVLALVAAILFWVNLVLPRRGADESSRET